MMFAILLSVMLASGRSATAAPAAPASQPAIAGVVAETMDSGGYTYVRLSQDKKTLWLAMPQTRVTVGKKMYFAPGMEMRDFTSKTLKRTFPVIIFTNGTAAAPAKGKSHGGVKAAHGARTASLEPGLKLPKAEGADGVTVAELYSRRKELDGKDVSVRGKVVKVSTMIMGKNWLHLQDGTGDSGQGTHDLVVTTLQSIDVGPVVVAKGKARVDQNIGAGYAYPVLVENALLSK